MRYVLALLTAAGLVLLTLYGIANVRGASTLDWPSGAVSEVRHGGGTIIFLHQTAAQHQAIERWVKSPAGTPHPTEFAEVFLVEVALP